MSPITYDEMRPGLLRPEGAASTTWTLNWVEASLCVPDVPALLRPDVPRGARTASSRCACVHAYNDWMVEEWCGDSGGRLHPAVPHPAVGRRARGRRGPRATRRAACARCASARSRPTSGCRSIHTGYWDPFFAACQETEHRRVHAHRLVVEDAGDVARRAGRGRGARCSFNNAMASLADFLFSGVLVRFPTLKLAYSEGQIGWIPYVLERADDVWESTARGAASKDIVPEPPSTYYYRPGLRLLLPRPPRPRVARRGRRRQHHASRPTTRTPTRRGPIAREDAETDDRRHSTDEQRYKILRGNAIRMLELDRV